MSQHWAVIPVKGLLDSKKRLSSYLGDNKKLLVEALLHDVLSSAFQSNMYDKILVISPDDHVAVQARMNKAAFVKQTSFGLNHAVEQANRLAQRENVLSLTTILADIPLAEPRDFRELLSLGDEGRKVVIAPSLKGGTNVLITRPPGAVRPSYGRWSYSKHLRQAQLNGITLYSISNSRLSFDIDTVDDLNELKRRDLDLRTASGRALSRLGPVLRSMKVSLPKDVYS